MHDTLRSRMVIPSATRPQDPDGAASAHVTAPDDLEHVRRAQADPKAFAPLYDRYAPVVYHYCLRRMSHPETAADATSLVFTRALAALGRFKVDPRRAGSSFRSWLFTIAHNVIVDQHRRSWVHVSLEQHEQALAGSPHLVDPAASPEDVAVHSDELARLSALLCRLPDQQRAIIELRLAGLAGAEISATLGMSVSAVKSAQFRAYATLRKLLHERASSDLTRRSPDDH